MARYLLLLLALVIGISVGLYFPRHPRPVDRARFLRLVGLVIAAVFAVLAGAFLAGEGFTDPGGWRGVGYVASWLLPLAAFAVLAWLRPDLATIVLAVLTACIVATSAWLVAAPDAWRSFENDVGPVRVVTVFVALVPLALLGWRRPLAAGIMLLVGGVAPVLAVLVRDPAAGVAAGSVGAVSTPVVVTGILYLTSAAMTRGAGHSTSPRPATGHRPKPA